MSDRTIKTHLVPGEKNPIKVESKDEASFSAHHRYKLSGFNCIYNDSYISAPLPKTGGDAHKELNIYFQKGPVSDEGPNGITVESLLAICADRLTCFQAGPFSSTMNQVALDAIEIAIAALQIRTRSRLAEGTKHTNQLDGATVSKSMVAMVEYANNMAAIKRAFVGDSADDKK